MTITQGFRTWYRNRKLARTLTIALATATVATPYTAQAADGVADVIVGADVTELSDGKSTPTINTNILVVGTPPYGGKIIVRDIARTTYDGRVQSKNFLLGRLETPSLGGFALGLEGQILTDIAEEKTLMTSGLGAVVYRNQLGPVFMMLETAANQTGTWEQTLLASVGLGKYSVSVEGVGTFKKDDLTALAIFARALYKATENTKVGVGVDTTTVGRGNDNYESSVIPAIAAQGTF